jgi:hypothetical protein
MYTSLDEVELAVVVNLETLREVLMSMSIDAKRWWIASDPHDAVAGGYISIGHGTPAAPIVLTPCIFAFPC